MFLRRGRGTTTALLVAISATLIVGCTLLLDFDDPPGPPDAMVPDAIPAAACEYGEPNDQRSMAFPLEVVSGQSAGICTEGDRDFYAITLFDTGAEVTVEVLFMQDGARGDLDMRLLDVDGNIVARSLSTDADERIVCPGTSPACPQLAPGNYFVEVFGFADSTLNGYTLNYATTGGVPPDAGI
jgi:hypothetical protein